VCSTAPCEGPGSWEPTFTLQNRLSEEARLLILLVLVVDASGDLAWIRSVLDGAVLPIVVRHKLLLKVEGVVDVGEAELDVRVLGMLG
jgi:hypothetical protein